MTATVELIPEGFTVEIDGSEELPCVVVATVCETPVPEDDAELRLGFNVLVAETCIEVESSVVWLRIVEMVETSVGGVPFDEMLTDADESLVLVVRIVEPLDAEPV